MIPASVDKNREEAEFVAAVMSFPQHSQQWITRIVERVDFSDIEQYAHTLTLHVDLERFRVAYGDGTLLAPKQPLLLPLLWLRRGVHVGIVVRDASNAEVARYAKSEERSAILRVALEVLDVLMNRIAATPLSARVQRRPVTNRKTRAARTIVVRTHLRRGLREIEASLRNLVHKAINEESVVDARASAVELSESLANLRAQWADVSGLANLLESIVNTFSENFLLLALVEPEGAARRTFTVSYVEPARVSGRRSSNRQPDSAAEVIWGNASGWRRRLRTCRRIVFKWAAVPSRERLIYFPLWNLTSRFHIELTAPPGVFLIDSQVGWTKQDPLSKTTVYGGERKDDNKLLQVAHLSAEGPDRDSWETVIVKTHLYPTVSGLVATTTVFGLLAVALLVVSGWLAFDQPPWHWWSTCQFWDANSRPVDRSAATAALLILPTMAQILLFRYDEHSTFSTLIRRTRMVFVGTTLPLAALAALVAFPMNVARPARWWIVATFVTIAGSLLLVSHLIRVSVVVRRERRRRVVTPGKG